MLCIESPFKGKASMALWSALKTECNPLRCTMLILIVTAKTAHLSSVASEKLLDENDHLVLLDGSGVILIEGGEYLIESLIRELIT